MTDWLMINDWLMIDDWLMINDWSMIDNWLMIDFLTTDWLIYWLLIVWLIDY